MLDSGCILWVLWKAFVDACIGSFKHLLVAKSDPLRNGDYISPCGLRPLYTSGLPQVMSYIKSVAIRCVLANAAATQEFFWAQFDHDDDLTQEQSVITMLRINFLIESRAHRSILIVSPRMSEYLDYRLRTGISRKNICMRRSIIL